VVSAIANRLKIFHQSNDNCVVSPDCKGLMRQLKEHEMAKGQQNSNKMVKKPKKDTSPAKPVSADAVRPTVTTVVPVRGKLKNAPGKS
jgi:hypothetical protein